MKKTLLVVSLAVVSANVLGMNPYEFQNNSDSFRNQYGIRNNGQFWQQVNLDLMNILRMNPYEFRNNGNSYRNQYGIGNNGQFGQQVNLDSISKQQRVLAYRSLLSSINSSQVQSLLFKIWTSRFYPNNNSPTLEQLQKFDLYEFEKWLNSLSESGIKNLSKEQNLSKYAQWKENLDRAYRLWLKTQSQNILGQLSNEQKLQKFIKDHNLKKQRITGKNHILTIQDISFGDTVQKFLNDELNDKQKKDLVVSLFGELSEKQKKALVLLLHRTNLQNPNIGSSLNQGVSADASALQDFLNSLNPATGTQETSVSQNTDRKGEQIITEKEIEDILSQIIEDEQEDQSFSDPNEASSSQSAETEETSVSQNTDRKGKHEAKESEDVQEPAKKTRRNELTKRQVLTEKEREDILSQIIEDKQWEQIKKTYPNLPKQTNDNYARYIRYWFWFPEQDLFKKKINGEELDKELTPLDLKKSTLDTNALADLIRFGRLDFIERHKDYDYYYYNIIASVWKILATKNFGKPNWCGDIEARNYLQKMYKPRKLKILPQTDKKQNVISFYKWKLDECEKTDPKKSIRGTKSEFTENNAIWAEVQKYFGLSDEYIQEILKLYKTKNLQEPARNIAAEVDDIVSQFREKYNILDMLNDIRAGNKVNTEAQSESQKIVGDLWEMGFSYKRIIELLGLKDDFEANYPSTTENLTDSSSDAGTSSSSSAAQITENLTDSSSDAGTSSSSSAAQTRKRNADSNVESTSSKKQDKGKQRAED